MTQTKVGWRPYVATTTTTESTLLTSIYGVWNGDTLGTSLDSNIYGVYNGDNVNDSSGNARNGTNVNGVTFTTGKVGNALTFNGSSNYVALPNSSFDFTGDFSISTWVKIPSAPSAAGFIFHNGNYDVATTYGYGLRVNADRTIGFYIGSLGGTSTVTSTTVLALNTWYHVTIKRDSVAKRSDLYINGVFEVQATNTNLTIGYGTRAIQPAIGAYRGNNQGVLSVSNYFNGSVDALTIWNKKLTDNEITSLYNAGTGAEYPFSSQLLPSPNDAVSTNHGTLMNGATFTDGKIGKAFTFDGINDYVSLPTGAFNSLTEDFSVSAWVSFPVGYSTQIPIFSNLSATSWFSNVGGFWLTLFGYGIQFRIGDKTIGSHDTTTTVLTGAISAPPSNTFVHIVATRKAGQRSRIYYNGTLIASNTDARNPTYYTTGVNTTTPSIGSVQIPNGVQSAYFAPAGSKIDAMSVWNKELTSTEVTELYNSGTGKQYPNY